MRTTAFALERKSNDQLEEWKLIGCYYDYAGPSNYYDILFCIVLCRGCCLGQRRREAKEIERRKTMTTLTHWKIRARILIKEDLPDALSQFWAWITWGAGVLWRGFMRALFGEEK